LNNEMDTYMKNLIIVILALCCIFLLIHIKNIERTMSFMRWAQSLRENSLRENRISDTDRIVRAIDDVAAAERYR